MELLNGKVRVYNYGMSPVGFPSTHMNNRNGNLITAKQEGTEFTMVRILWEDIEEENSKSDIFRTGLLRFNPSEEAEIYEKLSIFDKENIKTDKDIRDMLTTTTAENLKIIGKISSASLLTRMKQMLFELEKTEPNIPHNVITVVNERYDEIFGGRKNENSLINKLINDENKHKEENALRGMIDNLKDELQTLKQEKQQSQQQSQQTQTALADLLKMVQDLKSENDQLKNQSATKATENTTESIEEVKTTKKAKVSK